MFDKHGSHGVVRVLGGQEVSYDSPLAQMVFFGMIVFLTFVVLMAYLFIQRLWTACDQIKEIREALTWEEPEVQQPEIVEAALEAFSIAGSPSDSRTAPSSPAPSRQTS